MAFVWFSPLRTLRDLDLRPPDRAAPSGGRASARGIGAGVSRRRTARHERLGVERQQVVDLLPDPDEPDRHPEVVLDREHDPALRGRVELRQHDAGQPDGLVERLRLGEAVLAGRRIEHEERLGLGAGQALVDDPADLRQLVHQVRLRVEPAGGVGDDEVGAAGDGRVERVVDDGAGIGAGRVGDDRDAGPVGPDPELVDGGGAERVGGGEETRRPSRRVAGGELADRRGLAGPVDADDEHDRGPAARPTGRG